MTIVSSSQPWVTVAASWARAEPERGRYDAAALARVRVAVNEVRRAGAEPVVVVHAGALPLWQIDRGGWLDRDAVATWGCWVERLAEAVVDRVGTWISLHTPLDEARAYGADVTRAGRALLEAAAVARIHLRRNAGFGGRPGRVGVVERLDADDGVALGEALTTGRLRAPWGRIGELSGGGPAVDFVGVLGDAPAVAVDRVWAARLPLVACGGAPWAPAARARGAWVLAELT